MDKSGNVESIVFRGRPNSIVEASLDRLGSKLVICCPKKNWNGDYR